jgi:2-polyprenyl-3-methyl-5-hydroxy-6-metoxy-1,4-benzoquinol methylase
MISPVTGKSALPVDSFSVLEIIQGYKTEIGVDVSGYFGDTQTLELYQCPDTGLRFFYPETLAGDALFYTALENRPGYYRDWKWEYDEAFHLIERKAAVLDIGCGRGAFLKKLQAEKQCAVTGLELNPNAYAVLRERNIPAFMQTVEAHSAQYSEAYDVVTFFQVLEHVSAVQSFLTAALKCLKKNGLLILAVPNNEPYLFGISKYDWLNLPPHHMGWWNQDSLQRLASFFSMAVERIQVCPFRDYNNYLDALELNTKIEGPQKYRWVKTTRPLRKQWVQINRNNIPGVFVMGIYKKL